MSTTKTGDTKKYFIEMEKDYKKESLKLGLYDNFSNE